MCRVRLVLPERSWQAGGAEEATCGESCVNANGCAKGGMCEHIKKGRCLPEVSGDAGRRAPVRLCGHVKLKNEN